MHKLMIEAGEETYLQVAKKLARIFMSDCHDES
jgi:hypothetical protein